MTAPSEPDTVIAVAPLLQTSTRGLREGAGQILRGFFALFLCLVVCISTQGQSASSSSIEHFVDGVMESAITAGHTHGATVSIVQDGRLVLSRGYGYGRATDKADSGDLDLFSPIESRRTQFRIGSITKVLVWISVLQQVEAGKLDLDADLNIYLADFKISSDFSDPITLRHLMTHTAGFEDDLSQLLATGPRQSGTLGELLADHQPRRITLPGTRVSYSNYGAALAGYIVSEVAEQSLHNYIDEHVLGPLGMSDATTRQPVPKDIEQTKSPGFLKRQEDFVEQGFTYIPFYPAGSGSATALDVARLMVELLNPDGTGVLSASSKAALLNGAYNSHPGLNGMTLGMYEMSSGLTRAVGHDGGTILFNSRMILWPELKMGLFVSTNTDTGGIVVDQLVKAYTKHLGMNSTKSSVGPVIQGQRFAGEYLSGRRNFSNFTKIFGLLDVVRVRFIKQEEVLLVSNAAGTRRYLQTADKTFMHVRSGDLIAFTDLGEKGMSLHVNSRPMVTYLRADTAETRQVNILLVLGFVVACLSVLLIWPVTTFFRRGAGMRSGQGVVVFLQTATIVAAGLFFLQVIALGTSTYDFLLHGLRQLPDLLWLPVAISVLVVLQVFYFYRVWVDGFWWLSRRLHYTLVLAIDCLFVWWLWYWKLIPQSVLQLVG